ncbi:protein bima [Tothia fuscella]|uniref:Protein bima n=1 Tax=Tothia fuscella TaxID=1048955 RepID=A0A9P4NSJ9_9PEZI|nr:protein bima [Tothia fuscella]
MSPANPFAAAQLRQLIFYNLDNDLLQNALFLSGRLYALEPRNPDTSHLLALCHLKLGQFKAAYDYSKDTRLRGSHLGCAFVFAQACLALERYTDGITALERCRNSWEARNHWNKHSENTRRHLPDAAAVLCLFGKLCRANGETKKAAECYSQSLKLNPFMWDAFTDLCDAGVPLRTDNIFKLTDEMRAYLSIPASAATPGESATQNVPLQSHINGSKNVSNTPAGYDPFNPSRTAGDPGLNHGGPNFMSRLNGSVAPAPSSNVSQILDWDTPATTISNFEDDVLMDDTQLPADSQVPAAPMRKKGTLTSFVSDMMTDAPKMKTMTTRNRPRIGGEGESETSRPTLLPVSHKRTVSGQVPPSSSSTASDSTERTVRRSTRLQTGGSSSRLGGVFSKYTESKEKREMPKIRATGVKGRATVSTVGRNVSGNRRLEPGLRDAKERPLSAASSVRDVTTRKQAQPPAERPPQEHEALQWLLDLCAKLGEGYYQLSRYHCKDASDILTSVSTSQRETPWVLAQIGRAYYERSMYQEAGEVFAKIKKIQPSRMEDMEIYSTVLWHLKEEMELAYLSHELLESDRLSSQAWCAIGNSFSLQREHDQAVKCFKRATQLEPKFAYGFTLQGHEHVANEEFDKALHAYRCAISADNRHYNGWYGLGQVYEKLGKYEVAEKHYKCASQINPNNPLLLICIGLVLEKNKKSSAALNFYEQACVLDEKSAKTRFMKARVLMRLRQPQAALKELKELKNIAPDESMVHFMLGKLHKMLGDKTSAIRHLTIALNLDPKVFSPKFLQILDDTNDDPYQASAHIKDALESLEDEDDEYDDDEMI